MQWHQNNTNNVIRTADCILIKEWASVITVYSISERALDHLPTARVTNRDEKSKRSNSSDTSSNAKCASQKISFLSECSLSLAKQENQTWNQTIALWYQIKQEIIKHARNYIAPTVYPTKKPKKFECCSVQ